MQTPSSKNGKQTGKAASHACRCCGGARNQPCCHHIDVAPTSTAAYWPSRRARQSHAIQTMHFHPNHRPRDPRKDQTPQQTQGFTRRKSTNCLASSVKTKRPTLINILRPVQQAPRQNFVRVELKTKDAPGRACPSRVCAVVLQNVPWFKRVSEQHDRLDDEGFTRANKIANLLASKDDRLRHGRLKAPVPYSAGSHRGGSSGGPLHQNKRQNVRLADRP